MIVRCHGARGSIPVSGEEYLKFGGDTTCLEIRTENDAIIIVDAGSGIRRLGNSLIREDRSRFNIIFTHSHWDHILGFPFFKPLYSENTELNITGCLHTQGDIQKILSRAMRAPMFPVAYDKLRAKIGYSGSCGSMFRIDSVEVHTIPLSHPNMGLGYKFVEGGKSFVFLTDNELGFKHKNGLGFKEYVKFVRGVDILAHDSEYTPEQYTLTRGWGHSSYVDAVDLALEANVGALGLFHHNQDRSDTEQEDILLSSREIISRKGSDMRCFGFTQQTEFVL